MKVVSSYLIKVSTNVSINVETSPISFQHLKSTLTTSILAMDSVLLNFGIDQRPSHSDDTVD